MSKICFSGISGNGVNPLARIMKLEGYDVIGTDKAFDIGLAQNRKKELEDLGIAIFPQDGSAVSDDVKTLYISTAIGTSNPDIVVARQKNIPIKTRPDLLAEIFHKYKYNIAVGGTSGKTTTTAMIGYILNTLDKKPCMINGDFLTNYNSNFIYNKGDICVIEADESNKTIEQYNPYITLITNVSVDHMPLVEVKKVFENVALKAKYGLVLNADCINSDDIKNENVKTIYFSTIDKSADVFAYDIDTIPNGCEYKIDGHKFKLKLMGYFNVENAIAAIAVCSLLGIDKLDSAKALEGFLGTKRRLERIGEKNHITVINDFAHNPEKVSASVNALKKYDGRLIVMFQPHGSDPMHLYGRSIIESFSRTLDSDDILLMPEIFFTGKTDERISSQDLVDYAHELRINATFTTTKENAKNIIIKEAKPSDRIIIMGARDPDLEDFCKEILNEL